jgi:CRISPR-associated endonuclease/helicase Cas3
MNDRHAAQREATALSEQFEVLAGFKPMRWQQRLYEEHFVKGALPSAVSVPTGLGKTAVMAVWMVALAQQMKSGQISLPRRLVYVVDRRAVVDQATQFAEELRANLQKSGAEKLREALGLGEDEILPISTLRGQFVDNRDWLADPSRPAVIVGTVDMIGSRLLFEGYGVSRKMRPYHAGLLGADALVLLDEAHLVPPFEALLAEIAENVKRYGAKDDALNALVPRFQLLPLSATGRRPTAVPFVLQESDFLNPGDKTVIDAVVHERLNAKKYLTFPSFGDEKLEDALAKRAWTLSDDGTKPVRVIVYCNSRDVAKSVSEALFKKAGKTPIKNNIELFVGARRVRERIEAAQRLQALGFLAGDGAGRAQPSFLVATSAGEVGVDLDADHMVCDLVAWERMVQRFGRVNRRGGKDKDGKDKQAEIVVLVEPEPEPKKATKDALEKKNKGEELKPKEQKAIEDHERLLVKLRSYRQPFGEALKKKEGEDFFDVNPEALRQLNELAAENETLSKLIADAGTPAPLRPALNRALVDAWAMTSLPEHTGRPEVSPWLRGWVNEEPQTSVVWRKHLPVRAGIKDYGKLTKKEIKEIEDFFEAAPLHASEILETESRRVFEWLKKRAAKLKNIPDDEKTLKANDVVAMLLKRDGSLFCSLKLDDLLGDTRDDKKRLEDIERDIKGKTLVMDARFGGLGDGLLKDDANDAPPTTDDGSEWLPPILIPTKDKKGAISFPVIRFRILERDDESDEATGNEWRENLRFDVERSADSEATRLLSVQKWRDTSNTENDRAEGRPQALDEHQCWAAQHAEAIGKRLGLPDDYIAMLATAARLHDEGKKAQRWQRAFRAERDAKKFNIGGPLAKTRGPINQAVLGGYRHEFGSLPYAKEDAEFQKLPQEMQGLVLHLIAAHHGYARPLIATEGCEDAPPSVLEERAREVALRFARLQKRWGPWGLAWWEALLRAADAQASRANDERET